MYNQWWEVKKDIILNLTNNKDIMINEKKDMNIEI